MQTTTFEEALEQIPAKELRYPRDAYLFLKDALDYTRKALGREGRLQRQPKRTVIKEQHMTGQELLEGIRELALQTYGPMTITVFEEWGILSCQDFGEMVFILVEHRLLKKTEQDSRADFEKGYDFREAFQKPYVPESRISHTRKAPKVTKI